eukprot:TRINITY_DN6634_c0_g1_i2.p1 TRINITY_DN6634_c0_g1~~TRINITY_DN6634_c0_g1_i2.p1  ORF type:complete len:1668 (+),score=443.11 TRINITY_DN6634_c0_g1_i2:112-5115(+)
MADGTAGTVDGWDGALRARYDRAGVLGRGAYGVVYRAACRGTGDAVAVKVVPNAGEEAAAEAAVVQGLPPHPHVVAVREAFVGGCGTAYCIVMECCGAGSLERWMEATRDVRTLEDALTALAQLAAAVEHLHRHGVVHRDVKPANAYFLPQGLLKLGDFGVACKTGPAPAAHRPHPTASVISTFIQSTKRGEAAATEDGGAMQCCGTPHYMSPEACEGAADAPSSDVWALGVILYEMVSEGGALPFPGAHLMAVVGGILYNEPPPLPSYMDGGVKALVAGLLEKDTTLRLCAAGVLNDPSLAAVRKALAAQPPDGVSGAPLLSVLPTAGEDMVATTTTTTSAPASPTVLNGRRAGQDRSSPPPSPGQRRSRSEGGGARVNTRAASLQHLLNRCSGAAPPPPPAGRPRPSPGASAASVATSLQEQHNEFRREARRNYERLQAAALDEPLVGSAAPAAASTAASLRTQQHSDFRRDAQRNYERLQAAAAEPLKGSIAPAPPAATAAASTASLQDQHNEFRREARRNYERLQAALAEERAAAAKPPLAPEAIAQLQMVQQGGSAAGSAGHGFHLEQRREARRNYERLKAACEEEPLKAPPPPVPTASKWTRQQGQPMGALPEVPHSPDNEERPARAAAQQHEHQQQQQTFIPSAKATALQDLLARFAKSGAGAPPRPPCAASTVSESEASRTPASPAAPNGSTGFSVSYDSQYPTSEQCPTSERAASLTSPCTVSTETAPAPATATCSTVPTGSVPSALSMSGATPCRQVHASPSHRNPSDAGWGAELPAAPLSASAATVPALCSPLTDASPRTGSVTYRTEAAVMGASSSEPLREGDATVPFSPAGTGTVADASLSASTNSSATPDARAPVVGAVSAKAQALQDLLNECTPPPPPPPADASAAALPEAASSEASPRAAPISHSAGSRVGSTAAATSTTGSARTPSTETLTKGGVPGAETTTTAPSFASASAATVPALCSPLTDASPRTGSVTYRSGAALGASSSERLREGDATVPTSPGCSPADEILSGSAASHGSEDARAPIVGAVSTKAQALQGLLNECTPPPPPPPADASAAVSPAEASPSEASPRAASGSFQAVGHERTSSTAPASPARAPVATSAADASPLVSGAESVPASHALSEAGPKDAARPPAVSAKAQALQDLLNKCTSSSLSPSASALATSAGPALASGRPPAASRRWSGAGLSATAATSALPFTIASTAAGTAQREGASVLSFSIASSLPGSGGANGAASPTLASTAPVPLDGTTRTVAVDTPGSGTHALGSTLQGTVSTASAASGAGTDAEAPGVQDAPPPYDSGRGLGGSPAASPVQAERREAFPGTAPSPPPAPASPPAHSEAVNGGSEPAARAVSTKAQALQDLLNKCTPPPPAAELPQEERAAPAPALTEAPAAGGVASPSPDLTGPVVQQAPLAKDDFLAQYNALRREARENYAKLKAAMAESDPAEGAAVAAPPAAAKPAAAPAAPANEAPCAAEVERNVRTGALRWSISFTNNDAGRGSGRSTAAEAALVEEGTEEAVSREDSAAADGDVGGEAGDAGSEGPCPADAGCAAPPPPSAPPANLRPQPAWKDLDTSPRNQSAGTPPLHDCELCTAAPPRRAQVHCAECEQYMCRKCSASLHAFRGFTHHHIAALHVDGAEGAGGCGCCVLM